MSGVLHDDAATQGIRIPVAASTPANLTGQGGGFIAFNDNTDSLMFWNGANWVAVSSGSGSSKFTEESTIIYPNNYGTKDFAIGNNTLTSAFSVDVSANTVRIGDGSTVPNGTSNASLQLFAENDATGTLTYNTSDQFQFTGGDVAVDQGLTVGGGYGSTGVSVSSAGNIQANGNLTVDGTINSNTFTSTALTFSGATPIISPSTLNTGLTIYANGTGILTVGQSTGPTVIAGSNFSVDADGTITAATSTDTINGLVVNAGALSSVTGITYGTGSYNFDQSASTGTFQTGSGAVSLNGDTTVAANKNLTLANGTGTFTQTYTNTTGTAATLNATDSASSGTTAVNALGINLTGTANGTGANTITGVNFGNVTAHSTALHLEQVSPTSSPPHQLP
jgi:hypothetical protein